MVVVHERRILLSLIILGCLAAIASLNWWVDWWLRDPPNYTAIEDGLWLGGSVTEPPPNTHAVLNLCETPDPYRVAEHRDVPIKDAEPAPTVDWLREQVAFIKHEREQGRVVFVHCLNGVSRSAVVVLAYLMAREGWTQSQATDYVRAKRDIIRPNPAFRTLLQEWETHNSKR